MLLTILQQLEVWVLYDSLWKGRVWNSNGLSASHTVPRPIPDSSGGRLRGGASIVTSFGAGALSIRSFNSAVGDGPHTGSALSTVGERRAFLPTPPQHPWGAAPRLQTHHPCAGLWALALESLLTKYRLSPSAGQTLPCLPRPG